MTDDRLDDRIRQAARAYNLPPETPRDAMWARIAEGRTAAASPAPATPREPRVIPIRRWRLTGLAAAAAAILAVGVGIGRVSAPEGAGWQGPTANAATYRLAAQEHLGQSEAFLTLFRASVQQDGDYRLASASARQLLASNRLLLDSPAAVDPSTRLLLEDLELVLAEIAQLSPRSRSEDLELIRNGIEQGDVMPRLRTAVPSGSAPTQGVS